MMNPASRIGEGNHEWSRKLPHHALKLNNAKAGRLDVLRKGLDDKEDVQLIERAYITGLVLIRNLMATTTTI